MPPLTFLILTQLWQSGNCACMHENLHLFTSWYLVTFLEKRLTQNFPLLWTWSSRFVILKTFMVRHFLVSDWAMTFCYAASTLSASMDEEVQRKGFPSCWPKIGSKTRTLPWEQKFTKTIILHTEHEVRAWGAWGREGRSPSQTKENLCSNVGKIRKISLFEQKFVLNRAKILILNEIFAGQPSLMLS